jgi:uncharacterized lipoprotein YehR (DUF1307 family)
MRRNKLVITLVLGLSLVSITGCASWERAAKDFNSDISGGLSRVATVYDSNGNVIMQPLCFGIQPEHNR